MSYNQLSNERILSIDAFRGITILVMIFVNELAGVHDIPQWMKHMPKDAAAMSFVDVVFPGFLFIVGIAIVKTAPPKPVPDYHAAQALDPRRLAADPKAYRDMNVQLTGKALTVTQHDDYTWLSFLAKTPGAATTESLALEIRPRAAAVLNQDCYTVYGVVGDPQTVTRTLTGAQNDVPTVTVYRFESTPCS